MSPKGLNFLPGETMIFWHVKWLIHFGYFVLLWVLCTASLKVEKEASHFATALQ
jgi:hypothetical protein